MSHTKIEKELAVYRRVDYRTLLSNQERWFDIERLRTDANDENLNRLKRIYSAVITEVFPKYQSNPLFSVIELPCALVFYKDTYKDSLMWHSIPVIATAMHLGGISSTIESSDDEITTELVRKFDDFMQREAFVNTDREPRFCAMYVPFIYNIFTPSVSPAPNNVVLRAAFKTVPKTAPLYAVNKSFNYDEGDE